MLFFPISILFLSTLYTKKITKSWFSPSVFFSMMWLFYVLLPIIFAPEYFVDVYGVWYISLLALSCCSGSVMAKLISLNNFKSLNKQDYNINKNSIVLPLTLLVFVSMIGIIMLISFTSNLYYSPYYNDSIFFLPNLISIDRYNEIIEYPKLVNYSLYFIYPSSILAGVLLSFNNLNNWTKALSFCPIILGIVLGIIEGTRSSTLLSLILFMSSFFGSIIINNNGKLSLSYRKTFFLLFTTTLFVIFLFILIQWLRQGFNEILFEFIIDRLKSYFFGYLSAFTLWFKNIDNILFIDGNLSTFAGPLNLFGLIERSFGFYLPISISDNVTTNIYTCLRGFISDFSIFGSLLVIFFVGFIFQLEFQKIRKNIFDGILSVSVFYSFTLYSPIISIFHYNSIFFSWVLVYIIFKSISLNGNLAHNSKL